MPSGSRRRLIAFPRVSTPLTTDPIDVPQTTRPSLSRSSLPITPGRTTTTSCNGCNIPNSLIRWAVLGHRSSLVSGDATELRDNRIVTHRALLIGSETYGLTGCNADVALMKAIWYRNLLLEILKLRINTFGPNTL